MWYYGFGGGYMNVQMKKGVVELCILKLIDFKKSSAFEILNKIKVLEVNENTIYPILRRLKNDGYLYQEKGQTDVGAPRKYYGLTEEGQLQLDVQKKSWDDLARKVNLIMEGKVK